MDVAGRIHVAGVLVALAVFRGAAFEKMALIDSFDFASNFDTETATGTVQVLEFVAQTGADTMLWRAKSGGYARYRSKVGGYRGWPAVIDKRRVPQSNDFFGWLDYTRHDVDFMALAAKTCRERGWTFGIHHTAEENHHSGAHMSPWDLEHPEVWTKKRDGAPFPGHVAAAYPEAVAYKLAVLDELVAFGPDVLYFDLFRSGSWSVEWAYVKPVVDAWKAKHGDELPPEDWKDPRWTEVVAPFVHSYLRAMRAHLDRAPRKIRFVIGVNHVGTSPDWEYVNHGVDWRMLAKEGVFDGVSVMSVQADSKDPWESTRRIYESVRRDVPQQCAVYFPIMEYNFAGRPSYGQYSKWTGLSRPECVKRLLELAVQCGGAGITMECVDCGNYKPDVCEVIRSFKPGTVHATSRGSCRNK